MAQRQQLIDQGIIDADGNLLVDMPSIGDMFSSGWDSFADTFQGLLDRTTEEAANREAVATAQLDAFRTQLTTFGQDQRAFEENLRAEAEVLREEQNPDAPELAGRVVKGGSALGIGSQFKANKKNTDLTDLRIN